MPPQQMCPLYHLNSPDSAHIHAFDRDRKCVKCGRQKKDIDNEKPVTRPQDVTSWYFNRSGGVNIVRSNYE